jgi:hypothetical protein
MKVGDLVWVFSLSPDFDIIVGSRSMMKVLNTNVSGFIKVQINPRHPKSDYISVFKFQIKKPTKGELMLYKLES